MAPPTIDSIKLPTENWTLLVDTQSQRIWRVEDDIVSIDYFPQRTELAFQNLHDGEEVRQYFMDAAEKDGAACVTADILGMNGMRVIKTIIKMKNPPQVAPTGLAYLGSWVIPLADFSYTIKVQCAETGKAGQREAALFDQMANYREWMMQRGLPAVGDDIYQLGVYVSPADEERYDSMFVDHPLSRCRAMLRHIYDNSKFDVSIRRARAYGY